MHFNRLAPFSGDNNHMHELQNTKIGIGIIVYYEELKSGGTVNGESLQSELINFHDALCRKRPQWITRHITSRQCFLSSPFYHLRYNQNAEIELATAPTRCTRPSFFRFLFV